MIRIMPLSDRSGQPIGIEATGHSTVSRRGNDPLCAAVSILLENLVLSLRELVGVDVSVKKGDGDFRCLCIQESQCQNQVDQLEQITLLFKSTLLGLINLSKQYPQQISVNNPQTLSLQEKC